MLFRKLLEGVDDEGVAIDPASPTEDYYDQAERGFVLPMQIRAAIVNQQGKSILAEAFLDDTRHDVRIRAIQLRRGAAR